VPDIILKDFTFQLLQYKKKCTDYETKIHSQSITQVIRDINQSYCPYLGSAVQEKV
jgi:hypothetical protein